MKRPVLCEVKSYYWSCGNKAHRHRTEEVAYCCLLSSQGSTTRRRWTDDACAECQAMLDAGMTITAIAKHYGLSLERIRQVLYKWKRNAPEREFLAANPDATHHDFCVWYINRDKTAPTEAGAADSHDKTG